MKLTTSLCVFFSTNKTAGTKPDIFLFHDDSLSKKPVLVHERGEFKLTKESYVSHERKISIKRERVSFEWELYFFIKLGWLEITAI